MLIHPCHILSPDPAIYFALSKWLLGTELPLRISCIPLGTERIQAWEFPGSLVVRILSFHCYGPDSIPGWGTDIL